MKSKIPINRPANVYFAGKINDAYGPDLWRREWFGIKQDNNGNVEEHTLDIGLQESAVYIGPTIGEIWSGDTDSPLVIHEAGIGSKSHNRDLDVYEACIRQIESSDLMVARLSQGAYATMYEVGYARAIGLRTVVFVENRDMWFASPDFGDWCGNFCDGKKWFTDNVKAELGCHSFFYNWRKDKCESPIETIVCDALYEMSCPHDRIWPILEPQHCAAGFRIDLTVPKLKIAFEFDGFTYHKEKASFNRDRERDRKLLDCGWTVVRFHGDEIRESSQKIASQILATICKRSRAFAMEGL